MNKPLHRNPVILVVDDEDLLRQMVAEALASEGFVVLEAANAMEALGQLELRHDVQLLFTDIQMPGNLDGLGLVELVHERWPHVLLIVTSGQVRPGFDALPYDARFVPKPFNESEMLRQVNDLLSNPSSKLANPAS
jgi:two-component system, response regulator PdtaR